MKPTKIITLAQLEIMPVGTVVSPIKQDDKGAMQFDIQGTLQLDHQMRLMCVDGGFVELLGLLPDVRVDGLNVTTSPNMQSYATADQQWFPHRFILWSD